MGDNYCDSVNNRAFCNYDGGDCCQSTVKTKKVSGIYEPGNKTPPPKKVLIPPPAYVFIILLYCYAFSGGCMISLISFDTCENPIFSVL